MRRKRRVSKMSPFKTIKLLMMTKMMGLVIFKRLKKADKKEEI